MTGARNRTLIAVAAAVLVIGVIVGLATWHSATTATARAPAPGIRRLGVMAVAANYLDLSSAQLRRDLRSGRSLAEIADATSGKSSAGLIDALVQVRAAALQRPRKTAASRQTAQSAPGRAAPRRLRRGSARVRGHPHRPPTCSPPRTICRWHRRNSQRRAQPASRSRRSPTTNGKSAAGLIAALVHERATASSA